MKLGDLLILQTTTASEPPVTNYIGGDGSLSADVLAFASQRDADDAIAEYIGTIPAPTLTPVAVPLLSLLQ